MKERNIKRLSGICGACFLTQGNGLRLRRRNQIYRKLTTEWVQEGRTKKGSLPKQPCQKEDTETELLVLQPSMTVAAGSDNGKMATDEIFSDLRFLVAKIKFL